MHSLRPIHNRTPPKSLSGAVRSLTVRSAAPPASRQSKDCPTRYGPGVIRGRSRQQFGLAGISPGKGSSVCQWTGSRVPRARVEVRCHPRKERFLARRGALCRRWVCGTVSGASRFTGVH